MKIFILVILTLVAFSYANKPSLHYTSESVYIGQHAPSKPHYVVPVVPVKPVLAVTYPVAYKTTTVTKNQKKGLFGLFGKKPKTTVEHSAIYGAPNIYYHGSPIY